MTDYYTCEYCQGNPQYCVCHQPAARAQQHRADLRKASKSVAWFAITTHGRSRIAPEAYYDGDAANKAYASFGPRLLRVVKTTTETIWTKDDYDPPAID